MRSLNNKNLEKELSVKFSIDEVSDSVMEISKYFPEYKILDADKITNRFRIHIMPSNSLKVLFENEQHLEIILNEVSSDLTKVYINIRQSGNSMNSYLNEDKLLQSMNTFLGILSKSLAKNIQQAIYERNIKIEDEEKQKNNLIKGAVNIYKLSLIVFAIAVIIAFIMMLLNKNQ